MAELLEQRRTMNNPLGTVRLRTVRRSDGSCFQVRVVKIRMDGSSGMRWIHYARWWWEQHRGPVPAGMRVCHRDGNMLNDDPSNLVLLNGGEVAQLHHRLNPEMSARNHAACGRAAAERNMRTGRVRRATTWLPQQWYGVDFAARQIFNLPRRKRWMVYRDHRVEQKIAEQLASQVHHARKGSTRAAAFVFIQAERLPNYWRWIRSASVGWPAMNCMSACILAALADAGRPLTGSEIRDEVHRMRFLFDWRPLTLEVGVMRSCISQMRHWITSTRHGHGETTYTLSPDAIQARLPGPRIVPIRGRDLKSERFAGFARVAFAAEATS